MSMLPETQPTTYYLPPTTCHLPSTTYHPLPTTYCLLPTTYYLPPSTYSPLRYALPEMLRTPLEELCLEIGSLRLGPPQVVLAKALSPPPPATVARAIASLHMLGALADEEGARLSTLGAALARLAVHPRLGKLLLLSGLFRCVQPMLSIAAGLGYKSPFLCPLGKECEADRTLTLTQTP